MIPLRSQASYAGQGPLRADDVVRIGGRLAVVASYRATEKGQLCRFRLLPPERPGASDAAPEYVELLASSPRISRVASEASVA